MLRIIIQKIEFQINKRSSYYKNLREYNLDRANWYKKSISKLLKLLLEILSKKYFEKLLININIEKLLKINISN